MEEKLLQQKKKASRMANPVPKSVDIMEVISVSELARKMNLKASDLIAKLMAMGMMVTINQQIDAETATILASEFGCEVHIVSLYDETLIETAKDQDSDMMPRPPVVTVMGSCRPRQDEAAGRDPQRGRRVGRIRWHHAAYRRLHS